MEGIENVVVGDQAIYFAQNCSDVDLNNMIVAMVIDFNGNESADPFKFELKDLLVDAANVIDTGDERC